MPAGSSLPIAEFRVKARRVEVEIRNKKPRRAVESSPTQMPPKFFTPAGALPLDHLRQAPTRRTPARLLRTRQVHFHEKKIEDTG